jgi:hypothetical protein
MIAFFSWLNNDSVFFTAKIPGLFLCCDYYESCCNEHRSADNFPCTDFTSFIQIHTCGIAGKWGNSIVYLLGNYVTVFLKTATSCISINRVQGYPFIHISTKVVILTLFFIIATLTCEVTSPCGFCFCFADD